MRLRATSLTERYSNIIPNDLALILITKKPHYTSRLSLCFIFCLKISLSSLCMCAKSPHSCPTLRDPMDCSSGSSVHGVL